MLKSITIISLSCLITMASGCASIVSQSRYPVSINSAPSGANVAIVDKKGRTIFQGNTPTTVSLKSGAGYFSKATYMIRFSKDGYVEKQIPLTASINGWYFGNLVFGGLIGMLIVDPATGAMYRLNTTHINETLSQNVAKNDEGSLEIYSINEIPVEWQEHLVKVSE